MRMSQMLRPRLAAISAIVLALFAVTAPAKSAAAASTWNRGDVFVAVGNGSYQVYDSAGTLKETISDGLGGVTTGCTFNPAQTKLYTTNWSFDKVEVYDGTSHALVQTLNTITSYNESVVFAADGTFYVSHPGNGFQHFAADGTSLGTLGAATRSDWMDLTADQRTMFYTDESRTIHRWDLATNRQLPDFATVPTSNAFGVRLLADGSGDVLVAAAQNILLYDSAGNLLRTYNVPVNPEQGWFALTLGTDDTTFWGTSEHGFTHFDLATGQVLLGPVPTGNGAPDGICVKGGVSTAASADLSVTKTVSANPVLVGSPLTYTLTVTNTGPAGATGVTAVDPLPAGVTFTSATPSQGSCGQAAGTVTCTLGTLAAGGRATVTIQVAPTAKGVLSNTATVSADQPDPTPLDNSATAVTSALTGTGSAFGVSAHAAVITLPPTPFVSQSGPGSKTASAASVTLPGILDADTLTASTQAGPSTAVTSSADVGHANLIAGAVLADSIHATCTANATQASGATTIGTLDIAGVTLTNLTPAPNTTVLVPGVGQLVLNEQTSTTPTSITVNAVHLKAIVGTDVIIGNAGCVIDP